MARAGVGISRSRDGRDAVAEAARAALASVDRVDCALLFATPDPGCDLGALLDTAVGELGTGAVVGSGAHGVLAAGQDCEGQPSVAVMALSGVDAHPFLLPDLRGHEAAAGAEIAAALGGDPGPEDLVVVLPDPRVDVSILARGLHDSLAPALVVGAGAADPLSDAPAQWLGRQYEQGALAGLVVRGSRPPRVGVTQACQPATELLTATRVQGNWILELDGRPALDVYRECARGPLAEDLGRAAAFVLVAFPRDAADPLRPGGYLVRHVVGFSPESAAFAVPHAVERGASIALAFREPETARADLKTMLAGLDDARPDFGLYFDCCARGEGFFGIPGLEAAYLDNAFGETPIAGMFGSFEIGPIGTGVASTTELLTYTAVLALFEG